MKKKVIQSAVVLVFAALLLLPVGAKAEMYVEGYMGAVFPTSEAIDFAASPVTNFTYNVNAPGSYSPAFQGGLKIGTWFVKDGFPGFNYPDWMKYLGFYVDLNYHRLDLRKQRASYKENFFGLNSVGTMDLSSNGDALTLAFMFAVRYGFLPDKEVPFGRLQPYLAVGPALLFTNQRPTVNFSSYSGPFPTDSMDLQNQSSTNIALAMEAGLRWMALKNVSLDVSFKYRYAQPSYTYTVSPGVNNFFLNNHNVSIDNPLQLLSFQIGAAYHF